LIASKHLNQKNNFIYLMIHHSLLITSFTLSFIILSSLFSMNMFSLNKIYAQDSNNLDTIIQLPLPAACVFDDGENPRIDECDEIDNNEETLGRDNIFFTLNSPRSFDSYTCTLQLQNGVVISSFECGISSNVAEAELENLDDGDYVFTITAQRTISDNNPLTPDAIEEAASPPFNFRVGIGGDGGGFDEGNFGEQGEDSPPVAFDAADPQEGIARLNPIWRACDTANIGAVTAEVQNGLSGTKYTAKGTVFFKDFVQQLNKFNTNDFVLEIKVNFLSGVMVAELFPTVRDKNTIKTQADWYELDPLLAANEQTPKRGTDAPNRVPFEIESVDTECLYVAPVIGTSLDIEGVNTHLSKDVLAASNPPFRQCVQPGSNTFATEGATYKIIFTLDDRDRKNLLQGHKDVLFTIFQQLSGDNPEYYGFLSFDPYKQDEERLSLTLSGKDILTECRTSLLY
jgi:hypothetical protein